MNGSTTADMSGATPGAMSGATPGAMSGPAPEPMSGAPSGGVAVLPPVAPDVAAGALDLLPARLRKRVDGAVAKAAGWPVAATPEGVLVRVAEDTAVTLRVTGGIVADAGSAVCDCLLAPACLHRAAVLSLAPLAQGEGEGEGEGDGVGPAEEPAAAVEPAAAEEGEVDGGEGPGGSVSLSGAQRDALRTLGGVATAVLVSGVSGSGAVHRAELLHAAHSARLAGLPRPAATAVRVARQLGEARSDDPAFRLATLSRDLADVLDLVRRPAEAAVPARRAYRPEGALRLYGVFTEPVVTASGYAGATVYALAPDGALRTRSDVAPGGPERAVQASGSPLPGGCALTLRELGAGGGAILTSATVSPDGRIGGGGQVRSVRAAGAGWRDAPLSALWERPPAAQLAAALAWLAEPPDSRGAGGDLLFLDGTLTGPGAGPGTGTGTGTGGTDGTGFAVAGGPVVRLAAPDERPELPYAENLALFATRPGLALRLVARAVPDRPDVVHALAASWTGHDGEPVRADLGLRRLNRSHLPAVRNPPPAPAGPPCSPALPVELDLLRRAVDRAVAGGRAVAAAAVDDDLPRRLRAVGLATGAQRAAALAEAAADRRHDALGRLLPADPEGFALAWLAASVYTAAATEALVRAAWEPPA
ncbi:hypothetical protein AB0O07_35595 [Streptomyces sp. NPDC093085]|uniref:hypothetical protein n=1 Tax=Streptomyces sp. NPDC093085 TaxID=3155068 RepID=UPI0034392918